LFSFVELIDVPTTGMTSTDMNAFWNLINIEHIRWLESIILSDSPKIFFLPRSVYSNLLELKKKNNILSWLPDMEIKPLGLQTIYSKNQTEIVVSYSFSSSQIHGELDNIRSKIQAFLKKKSLVS